MKWTRSKFILEKYSLKQMVSIVRICNQNLSFFPVAMRKEWEIFEISYIRTVNEWEKRLFVGDRRANREPYIMEDGLKNYFCSWRFSKQSINLKLSPCSEDCLQSCSYNFVQGFVSIKDSIQSSKNSIWKQPRFQKKKKKMVMNYLVHFQLKLPHYSRF